LLPVVDAGEHSDEEQRAYFERQFASSEEFRRRFGRRPTSMGSRYWISAGDDPFALGGVCSGPRGGDRRTRRAFGARRAPQPVLRRGEERLRQVVVPAAGVDVVVLKNVRSLPGGS
jgi:hypothetical protein